MRSIEEIPWEDVLEGPFHPSPVAWEDQTFYFLLVDRFSDGNEASYRDITGEVISSGETPPFDPATHRDAVLISPEAAQRWRSAGSAWCGGNLRGITTKLGYLKRLGITAIWVSPVLKQAVYAPDSYHGYGTQNFLDIDPHFGTPDDLRALVTTAHELGMYVILDVIINHTADVFAYAGVEAEEAEDGLPPYRAEPYPVAGFRNAQGKPTLPFEPLDLTQYAHAYPDGAVWPHELQHPECFTRKGRIVDWNQHPEYEEGDFFTLKDTELGCFDGNEFHPSQALQTLTEVYKYWIAYSDLDGFRLDTVKHTPVGAVAWFAREIHQFASSLGKDRFYLIGEIVGDRATACGTLLATNMNAALGIAEIPQKIRGIVHGTLSPAEYFEIFVNSRREGECHPNPVWWRDRVVTFFDDHDQVGKERKGRLASEFGADRRQAELGVLRAVAFQTMTLGIPCLYYGTEQGFDGQVPDDDSDAATMNSAETIGATPDDQFIRECFFGGEFGAFRSTGGHFFREEEWLYQQVASLLNLRRNHPALRRGRQYLREISLDGEHFWLPTVGEEPYRGIIAWVRLLDVDEFVCALNTDPHHPKQALITLDSERNGSGSDALNYLYSSEGAQIGQEACRIEAADRYAVSVNVPPGGFVLLR
ncbi:MAG: alpha-amylase family glycosyl hydrolase [Armatimonadaceae bacterium]